MLQSRAVWRLQPVRASRQTAGTAEGAEEGGEEEDKGKYKWLRIAQTNQLPRQAGARGM